MPLTLCTRVFLPFIARAIAAITFASHLLVSETCLLNNVSARTECMRLACVVSAVFWHRVYHGNVLHVFGARNLSLFAHNSAFRALIVCVLSMRLERAQPSLFCTECFVRNAFCNRVTKDINAHLVFMFPVCLTLR